VHAVNRHIRTINDGQLHAFTECTHNQSVVFDLTAISFAHFLFYQNTKDYLENA